MTKETPAAPVRDPKEPIGNPPGGGSWSWDADAQEWVCHESTKQE